MARSTMADIIALVRDLIGDDAGSTQIFTDTKIERALDIYQLTFRYEPLDPFPTISGAVSTYLDWYSEDMYWEADEALYDASYTALTASESDPLHGRWSFSTTQATVLISGKCYDVYAAAADLLELMAAKYAPEYDVNADGASLSRSQRPKMLLLMAAQYRKSARVKSARMVRDDLNVVSE